jgi:ABC-2 type transport system permease protein
MSLIRSSPTSTGTPATLARTGRAEWSRIWSVRSSWVFALLTAVAVLGLGTLVGIDAADDPSGPPADATAWDGARPSAMFALFGMLALAVVASTADHATGAIVPTLQWTPRRGVLLAARSTVVVVTTTLLGVLLVGAASVAVRALVPGIGLPADEGVDTLGGLALVLACCALLAVGLGLALRSTAGGLVTVIALVLVLPPLLANLPFAWAVDLSALLPGSNALFLIFGEGPRDDMTVTSSRLLLAAWGLAALLAGGWRLMRTDANR